MNKNLKNLFLFLNKFKLIKIYMNNKIKIKIEMNLNKKFWK